MSFSPAIDRPGASLFSRGGIRGPRGQRIVNGAGAAERLAYRLALGHEVGLQESAERKAVRDGWR
jgi:hypothetical protein